MGLMGTNRYGMLSTQASSAAPIAGGASGAVAGPPAQPGSGFQAPPNTPASWSGNVGTIPQARTGGLGGSNPRALQGAQLGGGMAKGVTNNPGTGANDYSGAGNPASFNGGVATGQVPGQNAVQQAQQQGPSLAEIQAEMQRRQVGAQLNQNPNNSALAGYMS